MGLQKNVASQKWVVFAFDETDNTPVTGDAAQITGKVALDWGTRNAIGDTNPTEQEDGYYVFDLTQGETNGGVLNIYPESSTANVRVIGVPGTVFTVAPNFNTLGIESDGDVTKVNLCATTTTNTDIVTAAAVVNEWETQSQADPTGFHVNVQEWIGTAVTVSSTSAKPEVDAFSVSDDATSANNLELQYDTTGLTGDTFPATQGEVAQIGAGGGSAANEFVIAAPNGFVITTGSSEVNDEDATVVAGGTVHQISDTAGTLDVYYLFDIGAGFSPTNIVHDGRMNGNNQDVNVYVNTNTQASPTWVQRATLEGSALTANIPRIWPLATGDVMVGADAGKVAVRFQNTGLSSATLTTDQMLIEKTSLASQTGYSNGAIWYDDAAGNTGVVPDVDGTADNPVSTWAAVKSLITSKGLRIVEIANGSTVTLDANSDNLTLRGLAWTLALGGQSIAGALFDGPHTTGIGTSSGEQAHFTNAKLGACTIPQSFLKSCGIGEDSGTLTAGSAGEYILEDCYSMAPGAATPTLTFTGLGSATGVNNRGWKGGATWNVDSNITLSHCVLVGGGTTFNTSGADIEVRGTIRALTVAFTAGGTTPTVQFAGITGPITLSGTSAAGTTVNLYGVSTSLADTSVNTTVTDGMTSRTNYIGGDYALNTTALGNIGIDWANVETPGATVDLSATTVNLVNTTTTNTDIGTAGASLTDLGGMSTGMKAEVNAEVDTALNTAIPGAPTANSMNERIVAIDNIVPYMPAAIYIDTVAGTAGTTVGTHGTRATPSSTIADSVTLAAAVGVNEYRLLGASSVTLTTPHVNWAFYGQNGAVVNLGTGINTTGSHFECVTLTGDMDGNDTTQRFCKFQSLTNFVADATFCLLLDNVTESLGDHYWFQCASGVAGTGTPHIDVNGDGVNARNNHIRGWLGGLEVRTHTSADLTSFDCPAGQIVVAASGTGGTIAMRGNLDITDNASGAVTFAQNAAVNMSKINTEADTALTDYDGPTNAEMDTAHALLATSAALSTHDGKLDGLITTVGVAGIGLSNISLPATGLDLILKGSTFAKAMADAKLIRGVLNVEDDTEEYSEAEMILGASGNFVVSTNQLTVRKPSDNSAIRAYTLSTTASTDPVTGSVKT